MNPRRVGHFTTYDSRRKLLFAVPRWFVADVDPAAVRNSGLVALKDQLVVVEVRFDPLSQRAVGDARDFDISRFACAVLARCRTTDRLVERRTAIAAVDMDRSAIVSANRLKHLFTEELKRSQMLSGGRVGDTQPRPGLGLGELFDREIFRELHQAIRIIAEVALKAGKLMVKSPAVAVLSAPKSNTQTAALTEVAFTPENQSLFVELAPRPRPVLL